MAVRRVFDASIIEEVMPAFKELLREGVIQEATDNVSLVSSLLPVAKPTSEYVLKSKIDKSLQLSSRRNLNRFHLTLDVRILNSYLASAPTLPLPKITQIKNKIKDMYFTCLDLAQMFYSVKITRRSQAYLCFYSLTDGRCS